MRSDNARESRGLGDAVGDRLRLVALSAACTTGAAAAGREPGHPYVLTCDLGLTRDRAAVAVLHRD